MTLKVKRHVKTKDDSYLTYKTLSSVEYCTALSFYHSNFDREDARTFLKEYLSTPNNEHLKELIDKISDPWIPLTAAWIARLLTLQCSLPEHGGSQFVISRIEEAVKKSDKNENNGKEHKRVNKKKEHILAEIDGYIDDHVINSVGVLGNEPFYEWLKNNEIPGVYAKVIIEKITPILREYEIALDRKSRDIEIKEGYYQLCKSDLISRIKVIKDMIEDVKKHNNNAKQLRKPIKKKVITTNSKLKLFKWKKEDLYLKLTSIDPSKIFGAQELYVFDTKYFKLTHFIARNEKGLDIYKTAITNFNEETSHTYLIGQRKMSEVLTKFFNGGRLNKREVVKNLKIAPLLSERINEDRILLAVY